MWRCLVCSEFVESELDHCWHCGANKDGEPDATFLHADQYTPEFVDEPIARRPQFTLQGILVFTTLACVLLAGYQRMPLIRRMLVFLIVVMLILLVALYSYSIAYSLLCRRLKPTEDESSK